MKPITHPLAAAPELTVGVFGTGAGVEMTVGTDMTLPDDVTCTDVVMLTVLVNEGVPVPLFALVSDDAVGTLGPL